MQPKDGILVTKPIPDPKVMDHSEKWWGSDRTAGARTTHVNLIISGKPSAQKGNTSLAGLSLQESRTLQSVTAPRFPNRNTQQVVEWLRPRPAHGYAVRNFGASDPSNIPTPTPLGEVAHLAQRYMGV